MQRYLLSDKQFFSNVPAGGGVYRVHCLDEQGSNVLPVPRVLATDPAGVLYIGKARTFNERVVNLKKTISPEYRGQSHVCGRRYKLPLYETFGKRFPFSRLCVSFEPSEIPELSEQEALQAYVKQYGELPPLNRQG